MSRKKTSNTNGQEFGHVHQTQEREYHDHERLLHNKDHVKEAEQKANHVGSTPHPQHTPHSNDTQTTIFINHKPYTVSDLKVTAADIRKISVPPIAHDQEVFHVIAGSGSVKMGANDVIEVNFHEKNHGRHFVSVLAGSPNPSEQDALEKAAYFLYLKRGSKHGNDVKDWLEAESKG